MTVSPPRNHPFSGHDTMIAVPSTSNASPQVAMVGGGQLARMTHQAAIAMGQSLRVLAADAADPSWLPDLSGAARPSRPRPPCWWWRWKP